MATPSGDGGRDSELFAPADSPNVVIQYSIQRDWGDKIRRTVRRLKDTFPSAAILIFVSNQQIGAKADELKKELSKQGVFLDVRDKTWFVERANTDSNRAKAATELARVIVDPILESKNLLRSISPLSSEEAKTALIFLEMHSRKVTGKNLTKSSFEALVRGALHGTLTTTK
jgi:hypothetical protein